MNFIEICRDKNRESLNNYIDSNPDFNISVEINTLILQNELESIQWLYLIDNRIVYTIRDTTIIELVQNKYFHILEWIQEKNTKIHAVIWNVIKKIIRNGDVHILEHLVNHLPCSKKMISLGIIPIIIELVQNNGLEVLKWLHINFTNLVYTFNNYELYTIAFENSYEELLDWLISVHPLPLYNYSCKTVFSKSCISGNLKLAKLLYTIYPICINTDFSTIFPECALHGRLHVLRWLYKIEKENDYNNSFINACSNGHIYVLEWLLELEHIDKFYILEGFHIACEKDDTKTITFLLNNCHRCLATRNIVTTLNSIFDIVNHREDKSSMDIIIDTIYLRNDLDDIFMTFYKNHDIAKYILERYKDLRLDYTYLFNYYINLQYNDLCSFIVYNHLDKISLPISEGIELIKKIVFNLEYYKNLELLDLLYKINPAYLDPICDTLFINVCTRQYTEVAIWLTSIYPDKYIIVCDNSVIIEFYIIEYLSRTGTISLQTIDTCSICMLETSDTLTNCNHQFCYNCINQWYNTKKNCPMCRTELINCLTIG